MPSTPRFSLGRPSQAEEGAQHEQIVVEFGDDGTYFRRLFRQATISTAVPKSGPYPAFRDRGPKNAAHRGPPRHLGAGQTAKAWRLWLAVPRATILQSISIAVRIFGSLSGENTDSEMQIGTQGLVLPHRVVCKSN
ncbi:hypothetical protein PGT21_020453 [Puccinia graminis f. sp. tritici]|uniref:Uncharacterized protein n=1 Tax=Puccinia graminis f. sp. tritici TaxID=56615 RepID=A0A5B0LSA2_PUCGR|nr:hypothetical protein PGT21_020453 [Puccinia graminis f. sp. tritici]KAA1099047.1 hypothetical protein PGTUg99_000637 [Puccinia graminis f. sp. tritici]KAA1127665.1 hypothetical protein PGTUg99_004871 [Puccinia graminis f. sp. tritici]